MLYIPKIIKIIVLCFFAAVVSACGGGGGSAAPSVQTPSAQVREITCTACTAEQLSVMGRAAQGANAGDDVRITLVLTESEYNAVREWLATGGGSPPNALCGEKIYEVKSNRDAVDRNGNAAHHNSFAGARQWAVIRNGQTLFIDGRQEHGWHLYDEPLDLLIAEQMKLTMGFAELDLVRKECLDSLAPNVCSDRIDDLELRLTKTQSSLHEISNELNEGYSETHSNLERSYREGDIVRVLESKEHPNSANIFGESLERGDYRVVRDATADGLYLAQAVSLPNGETANNCNAAPVAKQYYVAEAGDNAWKTDGGFAFNIRGIIQNAVIQTDNFLFAHGDNMRDMHLELRAAPMTIAGFGLYADTGFKWENNGETQAHYGKAMAVYPVFAVAENDSEQGGVLDLYAAASAGKVHSDYYEDSELYGFAAGFWARNVFGKTDEWHIRFRRPLSAREINPLLFGVDARIGGENSLWRFGFDRDLDNDKSDVQLIWRFAF